MTSPEYEDSEYDDDVYVDEHHPSNPIALGWTSK